MQTNTLQSTPPANGSAQRRRQDHRSLQGVLSDVRAALEAKQPQAFGDVRVTANGGTVVLRGRVGSYYAKQLAQTAAMSVTNGVPFRNDLHVGAADEFSASRTTGSPAEGGAPEAERWNGKAAVAALSNAQIEEMGPEELVTAVLASELPTVRGRFEGRLHFYNRELLLRLAYAARRCCRQQGY